MCPQTQEIIRIEGLGKTFQGAAGEVVALRDIDLSIHAGEIFGIIGLSGAGKSTLVRCINYLEMPTVGRVVVDGHDLSAMSKKELLAARQQMGMIFKGFNLLAQRDAIGNVCYPLEIAGVPRAKARKRAEELLRLVGLEDRMRAYPAQMSGGQKQRVAIARALANDPKVLLCDEATSALDPTTTRAILELLQRINREMRVTVIVITHEMKVVEQICHRVAVIDKSHIVEMGDVREVFLRPRSAIARELVLPKGEDIPHTFGGRRLRLTFDGAPASQPVISQLSIECRAAVNILYANTRDVEGKAMGQMVVQLPEDEDACRRIEAFLQEQQISYSEEVEA